VKHPPALSFEARGLLFLELGGVEYNIRIEMVADDAVALAGAAFKRWPVEDGDFASGVADEAFVLKAFGGYG